MAWCCPRPTTSGRSTLEGGYGSTDTWDRTFRETENDDPEHGYVKADVRARGLDGRAGKPREGDRADSAAWTSSTASMPRSSTRRSRQPAGRPFRRRLPERDGCCNLRFDQVEAGPGPLRRVRRDVPERQGEPDLLVHPGQGRVHESRLRADQRDNEAISAEADYTPREAPEPLRVLHAARTSRPCSAAGRAAGPFPSTPWTTGPRRSATRAIPSGRRHLGVVKEKMDLTLSGNYQKVDGNNDIKPPWAGPRDRRVSTSGVSRTSPTSTTRSSTRCRPSWPISSPRGSG